MNNLAKQHEFWGLVENIVEDKEQAALTEAEQKTVVVEEKIHLIKNQEKQTKTITENLYGFTATKEVEIEPSLGSLPNQAKEAKGQITTFQAKKKSKAAFAAIVNQLGLKPIAVVSTSLFLNICRRAGVLNFEQLSADGKARCHAFSNNKRLVECISNSIALLASFVPVMLLVHFLVEVSALSWVLLTSLIFILPITDSIFPTKVRSRFIFFAAVGLCLSIGLSINSFQPLVAWESLSHGDFIALQIIASICIGIVGLVSFVFLVCNNKSSASIEQKAKKIAGWIYTTIISVLPQEKLIKFLWPNNNDFLETTDTIDIRFPQPPDSFIKKVRIMKAHELQPKIAVQWQAIKVSRQELIKTGVDNIKNLNLDPILYHSDGANVAILDQFGSFPKEKEVLDWLKNSQLRQLN